MRRRRLIRRRLTAEELDAIYRAAQNTNRHASSEVHRHAVRKALAEYGYTPLDAIRARYWLRRGKPAGYQWDE
jgi:hypothetical protein